MCGIAGQITLTRRPVNEADLRKMANSIAHRGPDGEHFYCNGNIGLAHRRLAIIDLSEEGLQPMANEDESIWIVFNGEIYNYLELRDELQKCGHTFASDCDTEVIVHAYEE